MKDKPGVLTRRDFVRGTVGATLTASLLDAGWLRAAKPEAPSAAVFVVRDEKVIADNGQIDRGIVRTMFHKVLMQLSGKDSVQKAWAAYVTPSDVVGLVPTDHLNPTHPEVLEVLRQSLIQDAGLPEANVVDAQGGIRRPKSCTALIGVPGLKAHWLTGVGTVLKNYIMYSGRPSHYHGADSAKLGAIWQLPEVKGKTRFTLVDALHPLCAKGPQVDPRYKWKYAGLIAGTDPVAVEAVGVQIIQAKRELLRGEPWPLSPPPLCLEAADKVYGLGTSDAKKISLITLGWKKDVLI